jgi:nucleoside-diphosphate-sugar epimerase
MVTSDPPEGRSLFVLGGSGFIGKVLVSEALAAGWTVKALARSSESARALEQLGAEPVNARVDDPDTWIPAASGATALIDLVQPSFPNRLTDRAVRRLAEQRLAITRSVVAGLKTLPAETRPLLFCISGVDDLTPAGDGAVSERSPVRGEPTGLAQIGAPVRSLVDGSGLETVVVYFGAMVYGAGKVYRDVIVKGLRKRRARVLGPGTNRLPLTHVTDAARALVHLAGLPREQVSGRVWVAADGAGTTQRDLFDVTADGMGLKRPGSIPVWVAAAVAGGAGVASLVFDCAVDNSALRATGFDFRYPSLHDGVPQALAELGEIA